MTRTDSIIELIGALAKAQAAFPPIIKDVNNPAFNKKYADLAGVIEATRKPLTDNGLAIIQTVRSNTEKRCIIIETTLAHVSGQLISETLEMPSEDWKAQKLGSAITYCRRYAYQGIVGVAPQDEDDDGNNASDQGGSKKNKYEAAKVRTEKAMESAPAPEVQSVILITPDQTERLKAALKENKKKASAMYEFLGFKVGTPIPASRLQDALTWVGSTPDPEMPEAVAQAFMILDWTEYERNTFIAKHESRWDEILTSLNNMIDAEAESER